MDGLMLKENYAEKAGHCVSVKDEHVTEVRGRFDGEDMEEMQDKIG